MSCDRRHREQGGCDSNPICEWDVILGFCKKTTCKGLIEGACNSTDVCQWNAEQTDQLLKCENACSQRPITALCAASPLCNWNPTVNNCMEKCSIQTDATACAKVSECSWFPRLDECTVDCKFIVDEQGCTNKSNLCRWSEGSTACERRCEYRYELGPNMEAECFTDNECTVDANGTCTQRKCRYSNPATCDLDPGCEWSAAIHACHIKSCSYWSETACVRNEACEWVTTDNTFECHKKLCPETAPESRCEAIPACIYNILEDSCDKRTCFYPSRSTCVMDNICWWDPNAESCYELEKSVCIYSQWSNFGNCSLPLPCCS